MGPRFLFEYSVINFRTVTLGMAATNMRRLVIWVTLCTCLAFSVASPTRRQFVTITETTSSDPEAVVTKEAGVWEDADDFDFDHDEWLNHASVSPASLPEFEEYDDDDDDYNIIRKDKANVDFDDGDDDDDDDEEDMEHQDAEENSVENKHDSEFMFLPPKDTRLILEDDDDEAGPIKVRHTGSYSKFLDVDNAVDTSDEDKADSNQPFEFTIDNDDEDKDSDDDDDDDFIVEDTPQKVGQNVEVLPRYDDEDEFVAEDADDGQVFENPEEDPTQVIYGDHVFLY